ncbi:hypothetical protein AN1V17_16420 [Vallitalea sediminicola]
MICIKGERICIRTYTREEYHRFWKSYVADNVMDPNPYIYNKIKVDKMYDYIMENESDYPRLGIFFDIIPIGELSLKRINSKESKCELGIILANDNYKGLGYGTEAVNLAIGYVFNVLRLKYIYADTMGNNLKMQRILKRVGFEFVDKQENWYKMNDRREDKLNYMLINTN